jgi:hypothetical protein
VDVMDMRIDEVWAAAVVWTGVCPIDGWKPFADVRYSIV